MQRYEKYKDSGVDWIGKIPEHWKVVKLKYLGKAIIGLTYSPNDLCSEKEGTLVLRSSNLLNGRFVYGEKENSYVSVTIPEKLKIKKNDILICSRNGSRDLIGKCAIATENDEGYSFGAFTTVFRSDLNHYLFKILNSNIFKNLSGSFLTSTINQLTIGNLNSISVPIPPLAEQKTIATFLDDKTAKIDQTIANKQKEIELLKERRQILIQKAVTKGLDDTVPLKDSGVDWIGEIPEHWEVRKLKAFCKAFGRIGFRGYTTADLVDEGEGAITISPSNIKENEMVFEKNSFLSWHKYNESPEIKIRENDILIVKTGSTYGKIGIVKNIPQKATINPQLLVLKNIEINPDYFYELLKSNIFQLQVEKNVIGSTIPTISETKILGFSVPVPIDEKEFDKISAYIYEINEKFFALINLKQQEIERLKEYKAVLIDNVVTGKVRVS